MIIYVIISLIIIMIMGALYKYNSSQPVILNSSNPPTITSSSKPSTITSSSKPSTTNTGTGNAGANNAGTNNAGTNNTGANNAGTNNAGTANNAGANNAGTTGNTGANNAGTNNAGTSNTGNAIVSSAAPIVTRQLDAPTQYILDTTKVDVGKDVGMLIGSIAFAIILEEVIETIVEKGFIKGFQAMGKSIANTLGKINLRGFLKALSKATATIQEKIASQAMMEVGEKGGQKLNEITAEKVGKEFAEEGTEKLAKEVGEEVAEETLQKVGKEVGEEVADEVGDIVGKKVGKEIAKEVGEEVGEKVAQEVGEVVADKVVQKVAQEATEAVTQKVTQTLLQKAAAKATEYTSKVTGMLSSMGPVGVAMLVFDIMSLILDSTDAGGYNILDKWKITISVIKEQVNKILNKTGGNFPFTIGPLDSLYLQDAPISNNPLIKEGASISSDDMDNLEKTSLYVYLLQNEIKKLAKEDPDIKSIIVESIKTELNYVFENYFKLLPREKITRENISILTKLFLNDKETFYNQMFSLLSIDDANNLKKYKLDSAAMVETNISTFISSKSDEYSNKAVEILCKNYGGIITENGNCMYVKAKCVNNKSDLYDIGKAWSNDEQKCYTINNVISDMCKKNDLEYDPEKGICIITEEMCKMKGGDPKKLSDGTFDCRINDAQNFFEMVFGTTIVRGLKQIFDPAQYEPCKPDHVDDGYTCRKKCDDDYNEVAGVCWAKPGQERTYNCESGYVDTGTTCQAKAVTVGGGIMPETMDRCPEGREMSGGLCYDDCRDGYKSNGVTECHYDDPRLSYPQPRWKCVDHYDEVPGTFLCQAKPAFDVADIGIIPASCPSGEENVGGICYTSCKPGYKSNGTTICMAGSLDDPAIVPVTRQKCQDGYLESELFCTAKAAPADIGQIPIKTCKPGWRLVGELCIKEPDDSDYEIRTLDIISYWYKGSDPVSYTLAAREAIQENPCGDLQNVIKGIGSCTGTVPKVCRTCNDVCGELSTMTCVPGSTCSGFTPKNCRTCSDVCSGLSAQTCVPGSTCSGWDKCKSKVWGVCVGAAVTRSLSCTGGTLTTRSLDCTGGNVVTRAASRSCPDGHAFDDIKAFCYPECRSGFKKVGLTCWRNKPMSMLIPESNKMRPEYSCTSNRELVAGLCYLKCETGYKREGTVCFANKISYNRDIIDNPDNKDLDIKCRTGYKRVSETDITCVKDSYDRKSQGLAGCTSDRDHIDALCYKKCPKDLDETGTDLGTGYTRFGLICYPPRGQSYTRATAPCADGFDPISGICWRHSYDRGVGKPPYDCKSNRQLISGLCYEKCEYRNTDDIKYKHLEGAPTQCVPERGLVYPKSVFSYVPTTYGKKRAIAFSEADQVGEK